jgi:nucleoside-triphosphatase THEP1
MGGVIILTGGRGVGKSTVCHKAVALAGRRGYACGGILTLTRQGARHVLDVGSGQQYRLTRTSGKGEAVIQGRFRFDPQTLSRGEAALSRATPCDLLVVDEVGPLELERGQGWASAFDVLRAGEYGLALLVVRPALIAQARDRLAGCAMEVLTVTRENRDRLPANLVEMVGRET